MKWRMWLVLQWYLCDSFFFFFLHIICTNIFQVEGTLWLFKLRCVSSNRKSEKEKTTIYGTLVFDKMDFNVLLWFWNVVSWTYEISTSNLSKHLKLWHDIQSIFTFLSTIYRCLKISIFIYLFSSFSSYVMLITFLFGKKNLKYSFKVFHKLFFVVILKKS